MPSLQCSTSKCGNLIVVAAAGDVDLATAETLEDELCGQLMPTSALALDCTGITFIDSMGLQVLIRARRHAAEQQGTFALIGASKYVDRVLELAGLTGLIPHFADAETARAHLAPSIDCPSG
jgi:anti-anti-sigma factor